MQSNTPQATVVLCATVSDAVTTGPRRSPRPRFTHAGVPVTWIASWNGLAELASAGLPSGDDVALEIPAGALESRQRIRTLLARGREAFPSLEAVSLPEAADMTHRRLLVEEGVRVALVDRLPADGHGSRRPAPRGWRCRTMAWGLWDVEVTPQDQRGLLGWLRPRQPRLRSGSLVVLKAEGSAERWLTWATRQVERTAGRAETLGGLAAGLAGEDRLPLAGSVLRAA